MKSKNVIFRLLVIIFAVGGAVASVNASLGANDVHLSYVTAGGGGFCTTIAPNPCTTAGTRMCQMQIQVNGVVLTLTGWQHRQTPGACMTRYTRPDYATVPIAVNKAIPNGSTIIN